MSETTFLVTPGPAITLDSGAPAGAGEQVKVDPVKNARLIASGRLHPLEANKLPTKADLLDRAKVLDIEGRTKMNPDELAEAIRSAEAAQAEKESS